MWNKSKSILLSIFCTRLFMLLVVVVVCFASPIIHWYFSRTPNMEEVYPTFQTIIYVCAVPAMLLLILLDRLLRNIRRQVVFVKQNITLLRAISSRWDWRPARPGLFTSRFSWWRSRRPSAV